MGVKDIRYYLNGFMIERAERGGVYVVACDGRTLGVVYDQDGVIEGADQLIIRRDTGLTRACKARSLLPQSVIVSGGRALVAPDFGLIASDAETYVMPGKPFVEAKYPEWRRVLPDFEKLKPGMTGSLFNSEYIARFDVVSKFGNSRFPSMRFWQQEDKNTSLVIQVPTHPEFVGIVMPMHDGDSEEARGLFKKFK